MGPAKSKRMVFLKQDRTSLHPLRRVRGRCIRAAIVAFLTMPSLCGAADESSRLTYYLRKESPLTRIEQALGITPQSSRNTARLTGVRHYSPTAIQRTERPFTWGKLFEGWRGFQRRDRLYGVKNASSAPQLFGTTTRVTPSRLYGIVAERSRRDDFGGLAFRWGEDRNLLFRGQPRPRDHQIYGPQFTSQRRILERQRWRPSEIYGSGLVAPRDRLYGIRRSDLSSRRLSRVNAGGVSAILDRGRLGRQSSLRGRRLFGL